MGVDFISHGFVAHEMRGLPFDEILLFTTSINKSHFGWFKWAT